MILIVAIIAIFISVAACIQVWRLNNRLNQVVGGSSSERLEKQLREYHAKNKEIQASFKSMNAHYQQLAQITGKSIQKVSLIRFNPFGDVGSDQSFSLSLLDGHNSGLIITSIHGRDGARVYTKPITDGKSSYTLSAEEKQALKTAINQEK